MTLTTFNLAELGVFVVSVCGAVALIIKQIQNSRCKKCGVCFGLVTCDRDVPTVAEPPIAVEGFTEN